MTLSSRWRDLSPDAVYQPRTSGRLVRMVGLTLEAIGIDVRTGDRCRVERPVKPVYCWIGALLRSWTFALEWQKLKRVFKSNVSNTPT